MRRAGKADATLVEYRYRLSSYQKYVNSLKKDVLAVNHEDIIDFIRKMQDLGLKSSTLRCDLSTIFVFNEWAYKNGLIDQIPLSPDDYPKSGSRDRIKRLTDEDLRAFTAYIDSLQENIRAAFWLLLGTGARVGEIAKLTRADVQLKGKSVYINITDAKWGSDRFIPVVNQQAAEIVWKFRQAASIGKQPLFRLSKRTIQWYATKFAKETGIEFHCHLLRHTFAAKLTEKGVPITTIQYLLGHRTVAMTAYYAQSVLVDVESITPKIQTNKGE